MFETASFHIVKPCNMSCKFCYTTFQDMRVLKQLSIEDAMDIMLKLKNAGLQKITFAGGEPMLYKKLDEIISYSKNLGLTTSIITNGSFLNEAFMYRMRGKLDWIGLSIDSMSNKTNELIGRTGKEKVDYFSLIPMIHEYRFKLKINTVVNRYNEKENILPLIRWARPLRWKVFDTLRVEGQNDEQFEEIKSTDFDGFIRRNAHPAMVVEDNRLMTGSYLLIDPQGRLFEDSKGIHMYSDPLQDSDVESCLSQINLDRETFLERGGIYEW